MNLKQKNNTLKICLFYHSVVSDWNHGNAHFLRGIINVLQENGHDVIVFEPNDAWSRQNLIKQQGQDRIQEFHKAFPEITAVLYDESAFDPGEVLDDADLVIVHEWTSGKIISRIGDYRAKNDHFVLFFHDTHHRAASKPSEMKRIDLKNYDGALVFGEVIKEIYQSNGWVNDVWTWHEAADTSVFYPRETYKKEGDLVWIGNWGDNERTDELKEFIIKPVKELGLKAVFYGVRYPKKAVKMLEKNHIEYRGWLPNHKVPEVFSKFRFTVHVPRKPYVKTLVGIPTIRPFEAMSSGIPLLCSKWEDSEHLFTAEKDYLMANDGKQMKEHMALLMKDEEKRRKLSEHALETIHSRHTCRHRVNELMDIYHRVKASASAEKSIST